MSRISRAVAAISVAALASVVAPAQAQPLIGSPLVGAWCSAGGAITGQGATFANNAHTKVFIPEYTSKCTKGSVTYISSGSGSGKIAARDRTRQWGGSDEPLSTDELVAATLDTGDPTAPAPGLRPSPVHHIPIALGAITVSYNLASCGIGQEKLNLRSPMVAGLFTGLITRWNDPLLTAENPALATCNKAVKLAVRSDGSGTTYAFKDYLSKRNPQFQVYKQNQLNTAWPAQDLGLNTPIRGNGNGGVAAAVKANDGAVGYVEFSTAKSNALTWAKVDGVSGIFNSPAAGAAANCDEAATGATHPPSTLSPGWDAVSITDGPHPDAYAICTFTYALVYNNLQTAFGGTLSQARAQTLVDYFGQALEDSTQAKLNANGYARLPVSMQSVARAGLATIAYV